MLAKVDFAFCFTQIACLRINSANHPALKQKSPSLREISNIAQIFVIKYWCRHIKSIGYPSHCMDMYFHFLYHQYHFRLLLIWFVSIMEPQLFTPFSLVGLSSITLVSWSLDSKSGSDLCFTGNPLLGISTPASIQTKLLINSFDFTSLQKLSYCLSNWTKTRHFLFQRNIVLGFSAMSCH